MSEHIPASEMVKRVAEALCVASGMNQNNWQHKQHLARAAVEAMMEPTEAMISFANETVRPDSDNAQCPDFYRAMLSEALSPSGAATPNQTGEVDRT